MDDLINPKKNHGEQVALTCKNHPEKRWSTKNITPIGCRSLFYNLFNIKGMGQECDCPLKDLVVVSD